MHGEYELPVYSLYPPLFQDFEANVIVVVVVVVIIIIVIIFPALKHKVGTIQKLKQKHQNQNAVPI